MGTNTGRMLLVILGLAILCRLPAAGQSSEPAGNERENDAEALHPPDKQDIQILRETIRSNRASNLAHARYATARLERYGHGYISAGTFFGEQILFPALRSDRMYLVLYNIPWPRPDSKVANHMLCFQRTRNKLRLLYSFRYKWPAAGGFHGRPRTLLEYLHGGSNVPVGRMSRYARRDISTARDYVVYQVVRVIRELQIFTTSDISEEGRLDPRTFVNYYADRDPLTNKQITEQEFNRRYGFPIAKREMELLKRSSK